MANYKRKSYNEMLVNLIFSMLGLDQSLEKLNFEIQNIINLGVIGC